MKRFSLIFTVLLFFIGATVSNAQDNNDTKEAQHDVSITIPNVALLDIENASGNEVSTISFTYTAADLVKEAGAQLNFSGKTNTDLYLQYTSIVSASGSASNTISAKLASSSTIPTGMTLKVTAAAAAASGKVGNTGTGGVEQTLVSTGSGSNIVTGIGSCYTGTQGPKGHQLTYKLDVENTDAAYNALTAGAFSATVVYTITEN